MAELKTKPNDANVTDFLNKIEDEEKRADSFEILKLMQQVTKQEPKMWGSSIIGFGDYHYIVATTHQCLHSLAVATRYKPLYRSL